MDAVGDRAERDRDASAAGLAGQPLRAREQRLGLGASSPRTSCGVSSKATTRLPARTHSAGPAASRLVIRSARCPQ